MKIGNLIKVNRDQRVYFFTWLLIAIVFGFCVGIGSVLTVKYVNKSTTAPIVGWEKVKDGGTATAQLWRRATPGGWIVYVNNCPPIYVPDPEHQWPSQ